MTTTKQVADALTRARCLTKYGPPETQMENEMFVANDGGKWFVFHNIDHCDAEGNWGMSTEYKGNPWGYDTREEAEHALAELEHA